MKKLIFGLIGFSLSLAIYAQNQQLPAVEITAVNYKYLSTVDTEDTDLTVQKLEEQVAMYDLKSSDLYNDVYDTYTVSFYIPNGAILAAYDKNGEILRTIERFKDVKLPKKVREALGTRYPNWNFEKDVYHVTYFSKGAKVKKQYKVKLTNNDQVIRVKLDETGDFL
ncbi:nicotinate-nucleotide adenylyltransferase [Aestuariivivens sediminis]|uniref:nicotinate-nucleotide adenylyltransferase n=1 Tax=Aestuariivivens sediminis TaxID=2913557 RepID=UPI001F57899B|nr:nicotinate-nucleotide adenylyltransferase [Aestuariivivens sediminis]